VGLATANLQELHILFSAINHRRMRMPTMEIPIRTMEMNASHGTEKCGKELHHGSPSTPSVAFLIASHAPSINRASTIRPNASRMVYSTKTAVRWQGLLLAQMVTSSVGKEQHALTTEGKWLTTSNAPSQSICTTLQSALIWANHTSVVDSKVDLRAAVDIRSCGLTKFALEVSMERLESLNVMPILRREPQ